MFLNVINVEQKEPLNKYFYKYSKNKFMSFLPLYK